MAVASFAGEQAKHHDAGSCGFVFFFSLPELMGLKLFGKTILVVNKKHLGAILPGSELFRNPEMLLFLLGPFKTNQQAAPTKQTHRCRTFTWEALFMVARAEAWTWLELLD